ncbi:EAL domain-containing protein [Butyrivibrio sp. MC2021]|uniref:EAL domain-containing protein n=1 Tax=Butyrivibrio sp. MC2021 TaxID=1408306 RepID=UPI0004794D0C|nr:EAL domain-containing protein [Butyrivibrio sp. MC2021]
MWKINYSIPTLLVLCIIVAFYISLPRLKIRRNFGFLCIILVESLVMLFNILSSWVDNNYQLFPLWFVHVLNAGYFIFFFLSGVTYFYFTICLYDIKPLDDPVHTWIVRGPYALAIILTVLSPFFRFIYYFDENGYHNGPLYFLVYAIFTYYLLLSFYCMFKFRHKLKRRRERLAIFIYNLFLAAGLLVRYLLPDYLFMDIFCLIVILIIYLSFMNPEFYLETRNIIFNSKAFKEFIDEHNGRLHYRILGIIIHNYNEMRDLYGSLQMDRAIYSIGRYLTTTYKNQYVFYYKSGRFIILGEQDMDYYQMSWEIKERFKEPWRNEDAEIYLEAGFATIDPGQTVESADIIMSSLIGALGKADTLENGSQVHVSYIELKSNEREAAIKRALTYAINHDQVEVFLQPLISSKTGELTGAEVLARIRDQEGQIISPSLFIPIAEKNGKINNIGEQVFEKTCQLIKDGLLTKLGLSFINVNLSPLQFMRSNLAERYSSLARDYGIDPEKIHLEITEESMVDDAFLQKQIQSLGDEGFSFALDDYGKGYSNLSRLKQCPFSNIKLDMSIVWDYCKDPDEFLPAMIQAFKHMSFSITAEGIESEDMAATMKNIGCDYLQGYHYSKPLPVNQFIEKFGI